MSPLLKIVLMSAGLGAAALTGGCTKTELHHGYVFDADLANSVKPGVDDRQSVAATLGQPTLGGQFDSSEWYYWGRSTKGFSFARAKPVEQTVLRIRFDKKGTVTNVDRLGMDQVASINPTDKKTPTLGRKEGFFQELFGNIGTVTPGGIGGGQPPQ